MKVTAVVYALVLLVMVVFFFLNMDTIFAQGKFALAYVFFCALDFGHVCPFSVFHIRDNCC